MNKADAIRMQEVLDLMLTGHKAEVGRMRETLNGTEAQLERAYQALRDLMDCEKVRRAVDEELRQKIKGVIDPLDHEVYE